ncbi:HAD family hydrolase [Deferribacterales bacterium Es71-Z0220]|uniref:HAD family hydrolase n=1 Tax=Deferrivibrio essentukiensis TaxID=2880922 RepID=UPI001F611179|nr:HAD family hydrolase [Deferrivibrio essentukiensis]MCB4204125.1 HAD family hydrolase [Deferrivibrio essentukiensis]
MFNLFIFDLDGTILDTIEDIHDSLIETLRYFNLKTFDIETTKSYVGDGFKMLVKRAIGNTSFKDEYEKKFREIYQEKQINKTKPFENIFQVFEYLKSQNKIMVILSNKAFKNTDYLVKHYQLDNYFDNWYGADSFPEKKPSPKSIISILNQYNFSSSEAIIIGDNYTDIEAGKNANIKTCFCEYGYGKLSGVMPDFRAKDIAELINICKQR